MNFFSKTLPSGMRLIHRCENIPVTYCGFAVNTGTRDEQENEQGLAHFVEHMLFKGTEKHKSRHILNCLDTVGGSLEAYTTKEETFVYAVVPAIYFGRAAELLSDMLFNSVFPPAEIEKEIDVVLDEMQSYNDSPSELIYDDFETMMYPDSTLGYKILGQKEQLLSFRQEDLGRFVKQHYAPHEIVFFSLGNQSEKQWQRIAEKHLNQPLCRQLEKNRVCPTNYFPQIVHKKRDTFQTHILVGNMGYSLHHPQRLGLYVLNDMLGGSGMNALLNLSIREKNGLAYTVESEITSYSDTGLFSVYMGCDHKNADRCVELLQKELKKLRENRLSDAALNAFKRQIKGKMMVASQNREMYALSMARSFLHNIPFDEPDELCAKIDAITPLQLLEVANQVFEADRLSYLFFD